MYPYLFSNVYTNSAHCINDELDLICICRRCSPQSYHVRHFMMTSSNGIIFRVTGHLCGNSPVPAQRPATQSFDVFFDLRPNKRLSKQSRCWWFDMPSRHYDVTVMSCGVYCNIRCLENNIALIGFSWPIIFKKCNWTTDDWDLFVMKFAEQTLMSFRKVFCVSCMKIYILERVYEIAQIAKLRIRQDKVRHVVYHGCWWSRDMKTHGINGYSIHLVWPKHSGTKSPYM